MEQVTGLLAFPVRGPATFAREFNPPKHNGVDIFAERGSPVLAPDDGHVRFGQDPLGGLVFTLTTLGGIRYYGAHLESWQGQDRIVRAGEIIGYVGTSGNAAHTHPHLHLEKRDASTGQALDPYADLDQVAAGDVRRGPPAGEQPRVAQAPAAATSSATASNSDQWLLWLGIAWFGRKQHWW